MLLGHMVSQGILSPRANYLPGHIISGAFCLWGQEVSGVYYLGAGCLRGKWKILRGAIELKMSKKVKKIHKDVLDFFEFGKDLKLGKL